MIKALNIFWSHKVGVVFFLFLLALIGSFSALNIEKTMYPNKNLPQYQIQSNWSNYSPEVMELKITAPIERKVAQLKYVKGIKSSSRKGNTSIQIFCDKEYNSKEFELLLNETLSALRADFPENATLHMSRTKPEEEGNKENFLSYRVFSPYSIDSLSRIMENDVQTALSSVSGVAEVNVFGTEKQAYFITLKKEFRNLPQFQLWRIENVIREYFEIRTNSKGIYKESEFVITIDPNVISDQKLAQIPIGKLNQRVLKLSEIAYINRGPELKYIIRRFNGLEGVTLDLRRRPDASAISTSELVQNKMSELSEKYSLTYEIISNEGEGVQKKLDDLFLRVLISLLVIFIIVYLITKQFYNSLVVMLLLILSALFSIFGLYVTGNSINLTTIAGLALGFGMIIDNSLVVVEKLSKIKHDGNYKSKVFEAIEHILVPVKVATFTTIGAILPVYVMDELLKITLSPFVIALTFSLVASLCISILFLPLLVKETDIEVVEEHNPENWFTHFILWLGKKKKTSVLLLSLLLGIPGLPFYYFPIPDQIPEWEMYNELSSTDIYKETIKPAVQYTFGGAPYIYVTHLKDKFSWGSYRGLGDKEKKSLNVWLSGPSGMKLEDMNTIMGQFEAVASNFKPRFDHSFVTITANSGYLQIFFTDDQFGNGTPEEIKDKFTEITANFGGLNLSISGVGDNIWIQGAGRGSAPSGEGALKYKLMGPDYEKLREFSEKISAYLETNRRVKNIQTNSSGNSWRNNSEFQMELSYHNTLDPYEYDWIRRNMQNLLSRDETQLSVPGVLGEQRIYLKSENQSLQTVHDFNSLVFQNDSLIPIQVSKLGRLYENEIQGRIEREDQLYKRIVSFEYRAAKKRIEAFKVKFEAWATSELPEDIKMKEDEYEEEFAFEKGLPTWMVVCITLLIVFAIVAMYFESYKYAASIFLIVPFSLVGIIYFFFAMDEAIDSDAIFGLMFVAGIVINNAAFVIYEILRKRREGEEMNQALETTIIDRFRPVLLTTITTVIGILPLFLPQILTQLLDSYSVAYLSYYLPESIADFLFKNTNKDPMWYAMSLSIISGTAASFFFSLWVPVVVFYKRQKKKLKPRAVTEPKESIEEVGAV